MGVRSTAFSVVKTAVRITVDTLELLVKVLAQPGSAKTYCDKVGVPTVGAQTEWSDTVTELRQDIESADDPAKYAQIADKASLLINGIGGAFAAASGATPPVTDKIIFKLLLPALLLVTEKESRLLYTILLVLFFVDQRLQDEYPQGTMTERWYTILGDLARKAGWGREPGSEDSDPEDSDIDPQWSAITTDVLAVGC
jgi:hypothetical protein